MDIEVIPRFANCFSIFKLPELPKEIYKILLVNSKDTESVEEKYALYPLADSEVFPQTKIISSKKLTYGENVKEVFLLELPSYGRHYEPGDTIAIIPVNTNWELDKLFVHLKISNLVHDHCKITLLNKDDKLNLKAPFIDQITTLYIVFKNFIDIRCIPKKSLIRLMAEYTKDEYEKQALQELCSQEGSKIYEEEILNKNKSFLDLLLSFPSCCPPISRLLDNLPQLQPRPYSIASSPLSSEKSLKIVFTVAQSMMNGMWKEGLCTGMLKSIINEKNEKNHKSLERMQIKMFYRKTNGFRLPNESNTPLILIGPGSGIAPFIGFMEHRMMLKSKGTIWLFYGCRYKVNDYLFKAELENYLNCGILSKLIVSFSREPGEENKYVQDNIEKYGKEICDMICDKKAIVYVCGDAKSLRKDVMNALIRTVEKHTGLSFKEANNFIKTLQKEKRYLQDVWL